MTCTVVILMEIYQGIDFPSHPIHNNLFHLPSPPARLPSLRNIIDAPTPSLDTSLSRYSDVNTIYAQPLHTFPQAPSSPAKLVIVTITDPCGYPYHFPTMGTVILTLSPNITLSSLKALAIDAIRQEDYGVKLRSGFKYSERLDVNDLDNADIIVGVSWAGNESWSQVSVRSDWELRSAVKLVHGRSCRDVLVALLSPAKCKDEENQTLESRKETTSSATTVNDNKERGKPKEKKVIEAGEYTKVSVSASEVGIQKKEKPKQKKKC
ncbi:hypothetical protein B0J14DRAFT_632447 [Halenospora varia]|nr:hypothetical protein B0J14DRAFT_632447 [Halenospora varia]